MAEDEAATAQEAAGGGEAKSNRLVMIIGLVAVLVVVGAAAYFLGQMGAASEAEAARVAAAEEPAAQHGEETAADDGDGTVAGLDSFIVNLADEGAQRYLKVTMKVEFFGEVVPERFGSRRPQIRDLLLTLLSSKTVEDVRTVEGKEQLREEIIARINRVLGDDLVRAVYFAEFIVQ